MAILFISDSSDDTMENYERAIKLLEEAGQGHPHGRLFHFAARKGEGYIVVNIWESPQALEEFSQALIPILNQVGTPPIHPQIYPLFDSVEGPRASDKQAANACSFNNAFGLS